MISFNPVDISSKFNFIFLLYSVILAVYVFKSCSCRLLKFSYI